MRGSKDESGVGARAKADAICGFAGGAVWCGLGSARTLTAALMLAAALALALSLVPGFAGMLTPGCAGAFSAVAYADEPAEGDNAVNTQQLPDSSFIYDTSIGDLARADSTSTTRPCRWWGRPWAMPSARAWTAAIGGSRFRPKGIRPRSRCT